MNLGHKIHESKRRIIVFISNDTYTRLDKIANTENTTRELLVEKMINMYTPVPTVLKEGEFRCIYMSEIHNLQKLYPYAAVVSLYRNALIGRSYDQMKEFKDGKISWGEFRRKYVERLNMPDAIAEIARLRQLKKTQDIYITSFERQEEFSLRKLFCDYVNGKLVWN
jgi:uncharacterized protein YeaO (DUF488 family)